MQKYVDLVDLVKSFPKSVYLQKSASIQPRTSLPKFEEIEFISKYSFASVARTRAARRSVSPTPGWPSAKNLKATRGWSSESGPTQRRLWEWAYVGSNSTI